MKTYCLIVLLALFWLVGCNSNQLTANTPSDALRAYVNAYNRRDIEGMKQTFSMDTMKMYETMAQRDKTSVNGVIEGQFKATPANMQTLEIEIGKEEIQGDTATVESKNITTNELSKMPCLRENGQWKLAFDKFIKEYSIKNQPSDNSPSGVLKQYIAASQRDDIAAMKSMLSKGSLVLIEKSAKDQRLTTDDILRKEASVKLQTVTETRNEKIEGETATVEIRNETTGEFDMKMPLVKENGVWKLARDKYIEEVLKKANEEVNKKLANSALSTSNSAPNTNANNSVNK